MNNLSIVVEQSKVGLRRQILIALKHRLYRPGWMLYGQYKAWLDNIPTGMKIAIAYADADPIGIAVLDGTTSYQDLQLYVKTAYRRQGIGRRMVRRLKPVVGFSWHLGTKESPWFFEAMKDMLAQSKSLL